MKTISNIFVFGLIILLQKIVFPQFFQFYFKSYHITVCAKWPLILNFDRYSFKYSMKWVISKIIQNYLFYKTFYQF